jgi:hypothetical protein
MEKAVVYPIMRFNKKLRDPNAPRRNMSTYLLYQNAMRETFKEQVGTSYSLQPSSVYSFLNHPQYFPCHIRIKNPGMTFGQLAKYTRYVISRDIHCLAHRRIIIDSSLSFFFITYQFDV